MSLVREQAGKPSMYIVELEDITDRKQSEKKLKGSEESYRTLFEKGTEGIITTDSETRKFKYVNPAKLP